MRKSVPPRRHPGSGRRDHPRRGPGTRNSANRSRWVHVRGHSFNARRRSSSAASAHTAHGPPRPPTWRACSQPFFRHPCSVCGERPRSRARSCNHRSSGDRASADAARRGTRGRNPELVQQPPHHPGREPGRPLRRPEPLPVEGRRDRLRRLPAAVQRRQPGRQTRPRLLMFISLHGPVDRPLADRPAGPLHPHGDAVIARVDGQHHPVHQQPDDLPPVRGRRRRGPPQRRHFPGQPADPLPVGLAQEPRLRPGEPVELRLQLAGPPAAPRPTAAPGSGPPAGSPARTRGTAGRPGPPRTAPARAAAPSAGSPAAAAARPRPPRRGSPPGPPAGAPPGPARPPRPRPRPP